MTTVEVTFSHVDNNGNPYYRTKPNEQLICFVDEQWHTAIDDNCWEEPIGPIDKNYNIEIVKD